MNGEDLARAAVTQIIHLLLIAALAGAVVGGLAAWVLS
jgi:hypothetical protein